MDNLTEHKEKDLITELKKGNAEAFDQIFNKYGKRLYFFSLGYLKSKTEAEEVVQEVFYKIWKNRSTLKPDLSFKAYVFKIAFNHIHESFQKLSLHQAYKHEIINNSVDFCDELDNRTNYQSLLELVENLIEQLPPRQREILIRKRQKEQSIKEIATDLSISPKTVENHLTEALKRLRSGLEKETIGGQLYYFLFIKN